MQLKEHMLYGGTASLALFPAFGWKTIFFFLASVFIDLDHYMDFVYYGKFRYWNIRGMFQFHGLLHRWTKTRKLYCLQAYHTVEFFSCILAIAVYFNSKEVFLIFWGLLFHLFLDLYRMSQERNIGVRAFSFFEYWIRSKKMKAVGLHPEQPFKEAHALAISQAIPF